MKTEAIQRVQEHFERLPKNGLGERFYRNLFATAPDLGPLFPASLTALQAHFEQLLTVVIGQLGRVTSADPMLQHLGARHLAYGAQPQHYPLVREVLLRTLREHSDDEWTAALEDDWRRAISAIMVPMLRGAAVETIQMSQRLDDEQT